MEYIFLFPVLRLAIFRRNLNLLNFKLKQNTTPTTITNTSLLLLTTTTTTTTTTTVC